MVRRPDGALTESTISGLPEFLTPGDCLVFNDTRVAACKFRARIGARDVEVLMVQKKEVSAAEWEIDAMVYPGKRFKKGSQINFGVPKIGAVVLSVSEIGRRIRLKSNDGRPLGEILQPIGLVPLPPYITNLSIPLERYQTCFAREAGSTAAPTAGLHFTPELLGRLAAAKIRTAFLTLHVGPGTFRPVTSREIESGRLHPEPYGLGEEAAQEIRRARAEGRRVVAVGTTACRTLEHIAAKFGEIRADFGTTDLFIHEGFSFRAVDALLTNFHLPRTSLLMLVCALGSHSLLMRAYQEAIQKKFRFYSFGDAMLIL